MKDMKNKYLNPYVAGFFIGIALIAAYYFSGEGLGSSGAYKRFVIAAMDALSHSYAQQSHYSGAIVRNGNPLDSWLVFEILGMVAGAIISASIFGRMEWKIGKSPKISNKTRLWAALIGGILWGIGTQLGRGCTSGLVMSGMAVNSLSGYIGLIAIFGGGYLFAYFFRKLWI